MANNPLTTTITVNSHYAECNDRGSGFPDAAIGITSLCKKKSVTLIILCELFSFAELNVSLINQLGFSVRVVLGSTVTLSAQINVYTRTFH